MERIEYLSIITPAIELVVKKHEDYNAGIKLEEYFPFGDASYVHMLNTKILRLRSGVNNPKRNFESQLDSVYDLINYAVFYADYLKKQGEQK